MFDAWTFNIRVIIALYVVLHILHSKILPCTLPLPACISSYVLLTVLVNMNDIREICTTYTHTVSHSVSVLYTSMFHFTHKLYLPLSFKTTL
jgi:hypothetical protein